MKALSVFNVEIQKSGRGHIVVVTDDEGKPIRYPIRLSKFKEKPNFFLSEKLYYEPKENARKTIASKCGITEDFLKEFLKQYLAKKEEQRRNKSFRLPKKYKKGRIR